MAGIPAYCPHCGTIFQSRAFAIMGGVSGTMLRGNTETCVHCGKMASIVDGTFDVSADDVVSLVSGPAITKEVLRSFSELVQRAAKNEITDEELKEEIEKLRP